MKKYTKILAVVLLTLLTFTSCFLTPAVEEPEEFKVLNSLCESLTSNYTLEITVSHAVTETYTVSEVEGVLNVDCRIEKINQFVIENGEIKVPDEYKTVTEKTLSQDEIMCGLFEVPDFRFSSEYMYGISVSDTDSSTQYVLENPEKFFGRSIDASSILVCVDYTESAVNFISLSYTTDSEEEVTVTYKFN